jgi:hypothetical protein
MTALRHVRLSLAADTTDTHCGGCLRLGSVGSAKDATLVQWCEQPEFSPFDDDADDQEWREVAGGRRLPECIAADQEHAELVRDAEAWRRVRDTYDALKIGVRPLLPIDHATMLVPYHELAVAIAAELRRETENA